LLPKITDFSAAKQFKQTKIAVKSRQVLGNFFTIGTIESLIRLKTVRGFVDFFNSQEFLSKSD